MTLSISIEKLKACYALDAVDIKMVSRESLEIWKDIRKSKPEEQKHLLRWQLQAREPIRRLSDMKPGDHLLMTVFPGKWYEYAHHFLCSGIDEMSGKPKIIHYYNNEKCHEANVSVLPRLRFMSRTAGENSGGDFARRRLNRKE